MKIEARNLCKSFLPGQNVLKNINFNDEVHTLALIGSSGSGKSTFLRILGGLLPATSGEIFVDGKKVDSTEKALLDYRKTLGFVFQQGGLFQHMNALDNIRIPLIKVHGYEKGEATEIAENLLKRFGMEKDRLKTPGKLSGGQQQRVSIARAIAHKPKLLLLDEPTSALDPEYTSEVLSIIRELKEEGLDFIIVTHEMGFARHACEKAAFLYDGNIIEYGRSEEIFRKQETKELQYFLSKLLQWNV